MFCNVQDAAVQQHYLHWTSHWYKLSLEWMKDTILIFHHHFIICVALPDCTQCIVVLVSLQFAMSLQIYTRDPRHITPRVTASLAMGLNLGVFGFLPTMHVKTNAKPVHPRSFCVMRLFMRCIFMLSSRCSDIRTWWTAVILTIIKKPEDRQFEPHAGIKMVQVLGSLMYICGCHNKYKFFSF